MKTEWDSLIRQFPVAYVENNSVHFSFVSREDDCGVLIFDRKSGKKLGNYPFNKKNRIGDLHFACFPLENPYAVSYQFYEKDEIRTDKNARAFCGHSAFGKEVDAASFRAVIPRDEFNWEEDCNPRLSYAESICYCAHVRGFTKHSSSGVLHKGSFLGMAEKIPYLKDTGITTVELQPVYEFMEMSSVDEIKCQPQNQLQPARCNYWGYQEGFYYAPKASYASGEDAVREFKELVKAFHKQKMEVILQFYFPSQVKRLDIAEILRFWVMEYHVDGFHLMGENLPVDWIVNDPVLAETKIWYYSINRQSCINRYPADYEDSYLYALRRFLKGDEGMVPEVLSQMRQIPVSGGKIHYMSNYYGFTLMDMVSYDRKHNEENREENRDGNDYNCSWNCGEEGNSRKRKVISLRKKQICNAMTFLLFSQSTPLIFMGDEFGNSQKGNNNPYCQDNVITWLDWRNLERNREIYDYWLKLIHLRESHPILRPGKEFKLFDSISCGYPDLSYHSENAWKLQNDRFCRQFGMMFCGKYAKVQQKEDNFFYLGVNMYWEDVHLALPKLPEGAVWKFFAGTDQKLLQLPDAQSVVDKNILVPGRSCVIYVAIADDSSKKVLKRKKG